MIPILGILPACCAPAASGASVSARTTASPISLMRTWVGIASGSNSSWSEDCQYQREHYNTRCRKGQELPARLPDSMNASPDRQHDD
jgi:hypothetical protein